MRNHDEIKRNDPTNVTGTLNLDDVFVAIYDWSGVVRWVSNDLAITKVGELGWADLPPHDCERFKEVFARTSTLHERHIVEIKSKHGLRYRIWMWSIGNPDLAVCSFSLLIPEDIERLTERERSFMELLAQGKSTKQIAMELDVSVNTVHAHIRNVKTKLALSSTKEVASYAARFFHQKNEDLKVQKNHPTA
jgi:DNA-binding CsgD family transcriptional regulator